MNKWLRFSLRDLIWLLVLASACCVPVRWAIKEREWRSGYLKSVDLLEARDAALQSTIRALEEENDKLIRELNNETAKAERREEILTAKLQKLDELLNKLDKKDE